MIDTVQTSNKAIQLRRLGYSYGDIAKQLKVSKTSVSNWVKKTRLTESEKNLLQKNLKNKIERGRMMAAISIRARKVFKEKVAYENAEKEFQKFAKEPLFLLGIGLYWSSGLKKSSQFQFSSSDLASLKLIIAWMKKYLGINIRTPKYRVFIDFRYKTEDILDYWTKNLGIPTDNFYETVYTKGKKAEKDREYKGSLSIVVPKVEVFRHVIAWQKLAMRYYS